MELFTAGIEDTDLRARLERALTSSLLNCHTPVHLATEYRCDEL